MTTTTNTQGEPFVGPVVAVQVVLSTTIVWMSSLAVALWGWQVHYLSIEQILPKLRLHESTITQHSVVTFGQSQIRITGDNGEPELRCLSGLHEQPALRQWLSSCRKIAAVRYVPEPLACTVELVILCFCSTYCPSPPVGPGLWRLVFSIFLLILVVQIVSFRSFVGVVDSPTITPSVTSNPTGAVQHFFVFGNHICSLLDAPIDRSFTDLGK